MQPYRRRLGNLNTRRTNARSIALARILVIDDDPTARLTLQTVLQASGYHVDAAASAAEAFGRMEEEQYELVLIDVDVETPEAGFNVVAYARSLDYEPAAALIKSSSSCENPELGKAGTVLIAPEDIPELLTRVADLIAERATRRMARELRHTYAFSY